MLSSEPRWTSPAPGVHLSAWEDYPDSARILPERALRGLALKGDLEGSAMNAVVLHSFGSAPRFEPFAEPTVGEGEVLIHVLAAALHPSTRAVASGSHYASPRELPAICGLDACGRLEDGRRLFFAGPRPPYGTMAERCVVPRARCLPVPDGLDDATAAAIPNPALSSMRGGYTLRSGRGPRCGPGESLRSMIRSASGAAGGESERPTDFEHLLRADCAQEDVQILLADGEEVTEIDARRVLQPFGDADFDLRGRTAEGRSDRGYRRGVQQWDQGGMAENQDGPSFVGSLQIEQPDLSPAHSLGHLCPSRRSSTSESMRSACPA